MKHLNLFWIIPLICSICSFGLIKQYPQAAYPGGNAALETYLRDSLRYPAAEWNSGKEDVVRVEFIVSNDGNVASLVATSLFGESVSFKDEAKRLILNMPKWNPGVNKRGDAVQTREVVVVRFILPDSMIKLPIANTDTSVLAFAEEMPRFGKGEESFQNYLKWTIKYPQSEKEQGLEGTVYIYFEIDQKGKVDAVRSVKNVRGAPGLSNEAIRVIKEMPHWTPGKMKGKAVRVGMTVPIRFTLQ